MRCLRCWDPNGGVLEHVHKPRSDFTELQFALSTADVDGVLEIGVPSCNYRMGVPYMAYGLLTINSDGAAQYRNLWLPSRYNCLYFYLFSLAMALLSFVLYRRRKFRCMSWFAAISAQMAQVALSARGTCLSLVLFNIFGTKIWGLIHRLRFASKTGQ